MPLPFGRQPSTNPEMMRITKDIDDFLTEMIDPTFEYVYWEMDQVETVQNRSGLGTRDWSYDELQLIGDDGSRLHIHRRYRDANMIGRVSVLSDKLQYKIAHHSGSNDPSRVDHTDWALDPTRGYRILRWTGAWSGDNHSIRDVRVGTPIFRDESDIIRDALKHGRNPRHRQNGSLWRPRD